ncbi:MAG: hypothetical protein V3W04_11125 [Gammaproteobacteria bacterium]
MKFIGNMGEMSLLPLRSGRKNKVTQQLALYGKELRVSLSRTALQQLQQSEMPVEAEMELYFSCLIRKRVLFHQRTGVITPDQHIQPVTDGLFVSFNPVTTAACTIAEYPDEPLKAPMPIKDPGRFVPDWLSLDYRKGKWAGEYGFKTNT